MEMDKRESGCMFQMRPLKGNLSFGDLEQLAPGWLRSQSVLLRCTSNREMHRDRSTPNAVKQELCWVLAMELLCAAGAAFKNWSLPDPRAPAQASRSNSGVLELHLPFSSCFRFLFARVTHCHGTAEGGLRGSM